MDCIFCKIINREIPDYIIYEDDIATVFLDINPTTNGDSLIVPKKHYKDFRDVPDDEMAHMNNLVKKLYPIYQERLHCEGLTICHNADCAQEIRHFHIHFIPRYHNDNTKHISNKEILLDIKENYEKLKDIA